MRSSYFVVFLAFICFLPDVRWLIKKALSPLTHSA